MNRSTEDLLVTDNQELSPIDSEARFLIDPASMGWQLIHTQLGNSAPSNRKTLAEEMDFALGAFSENTYRSNRADWRDFLDFCQEHSLFPRVDSKAMPEARIELTTFALRMRCSTN